jgi:hypothetical protein
VFNGRRCCWKREVDACSNLPQLTIYLGHWEMDNLNIPICARLGKCSEKLFSEATSCSVCPYLSKAIYMILDSVRHEILIWKVSTYPVTMQNERSASCATFSKFDNAVSYMYVPTQVFSSSEKLGSVCGDLVYRMF